MLELTALNKRIRVAALRDYLPAMNREAGRSGTVGLSWRMRSAIQCGQRTIAINCRTAAVLALLKWPRNSQMKFSIV